MVELQHPNIAGNFLSNYYAAQQQRQAGEDRQRKAKQEDWAMETDAMERLGNALNTIQDGDEVGFRRLQSFAVNTLGIPSERVMRHTVADIPALRAAFAQAKTQREKPNAIQEYEYAKGQGYGGSFVDFQQANKRAGAPSTTINMAGEREFEKKTGGAQADMFAKMVEEGTNSRADIGSITELGERLSKTPGGVVGGLQDMALSFGVALGPGADDAAAAKAIIARLVPSQRQPGSGQMSDRDVLLFRDSLPKLVNRPGGNKLIIDTMKAMAEFKIRQAEIASAAMTGQMTRAQATQALMSLPDPMQAFRAQQSGIGGDTVGKSNLAKPRTAQDFYNLPKGTKFMAPDGSVRVKQ